MLYGSDATEEEKKEKNVLHTHAADSIVSVCTVFLSLLSVCVCVRARACVRACVCVCVCAFSITSMIGFTSCLS